MKRHAGKAVTLAVLVMACCGLFSGCSIGITNSPSPPGGCVGEPARSRC